MTAVRFIAALFLGLSAPAWAAADDFFLTYHVERLQANALPLDQCASTVGDAADLAGMTASITNYPGRLSTVSGGVTSVGSFVVQCIVVDDKIVIVVQGIDYSQSKGAMAQFADQTFATLLQKAK